MKPILFTLLFFSACIVAAQPKLNIYLVSHNEDNIGYLNLPVGKTSYLNARNVLVNVANMVQAKSLAYDYGADWVALKAIKLYDTGNVVLNTNGKNLVKWMVEDRGVSADPHSHESSYNYADVAYLMSQLGVTPSNVLSGYLYNALQNGHSWEDYQNGEQGDTFSTYTWYPEIKWGAGSPNHIADLNMFGVYRPKSMSQFLVHEPNNHLIFCGTGCPLKLTDTSTIGYVFGMIKRIANDVHGGVLPATGIYMQGVFFSEGDIKQPWFYPLLNQLTDSIATLVNGGKAQWRTITQIVDEWKASFNNQPFLVNCDYSVVMNPLSAEEPEFTEGLSLYPNPANDRVYIKGLKEETKVVVFDMQGKVAGSYFIKPGVPIDIGGWSNGLYCVRVGDIVMRMLRD